MRDFFEVLEQLYKKVLLGATLENDNQDYVFCLSPAFPDGAGSPVTSSKCTSTLGAQGKRQPSPVSLSISVGPVCLKSDARDITLLQLTVIKVMLTRVLSAETEFPAKEKYREIIQVLLLSSDFESKLMCMFQNADKLLSHMAAKCLASLQYFQLRDKITLSNSWIAFCQKNLSEYSDKVVYCLWTLTAVMKEIYKDTCSQKTEILKQFLTLFDTIFEVFYNSLFSQHFENPQETYKIVNSLICFLELLELLIASRIHLDLHFTCQRILFLKPACVLDVVTWPVEAFVKRRVIVFLKKCLLWTAGEDLFRGAAPALAPPSRHLDVDTLALADAVLQAVDLGLLRTLSVHGKPACFGGEVQPGCEQVPGPDHVILRAASLLIIKSLEIKFQNCASAKEMKVHLQRFMSELLTFLKPHLEPSGPLHNPCEWLSRVFIEQDDDMLEAAKATMGVYLKLARYFDVTECNDSINIRGGITSLVQGRSSHHTESRPMAAVAWHGNAHACVSWASDASSESLNQVVVSQESHATPQTSSQPSPQAPHGLVDYDTSDDSELESTDPCLAKSKQTPLHQEAMKKVRSAVGTSRHQGELSLELQPRPVVPKDSSTPSSVDREMTPNSIVREVGTSHRTMKCFEELQGAISRLQNKNLFPYNPTALLKLLKQTEIMCSKSMNPL
ncbi:protein Lines homolog 1 isoform 2-T3 [Molossus nigricans]